MSFGLALSGGGSRAAAFHRGTLLGLSETGLLDAVEVVSTVSGGSVFGAAWMASRARGEALETFLAEMRAELARGFIARTLRPRLLKVLLPGYTRSNALAGTFDAVFFHGMTLAELPERPRLVMNATVLNNGQVGKFAREGFKAGGLVPPGSRDFSAWIPLPEYSVALAATASAAFPVGLPPVYLGRGKGGVPEGWGSTPALAGASRIALTDGGVLENLGIQTLLNPKSEFKAWDLTASDAGARQEIWSPGGPMNLLRGLAMGAVSAPVLERITILMNDEEDRHMRHDLFDDTEEGWLVQALRDPAVAGRPDLKAFLATQDAGPRRRVLMVRVSQGWGHFVKKIPRWRLVGLAYDYELRTGLKAPAPPAWDDVEGKESFLTAVGSDLGPAKAIFTAMGGAAAVERLNAVATGFSALSTETIDPLAEHARWQVYANKAVYWDSGEEKSGGPNGEAAGG
ncbi:MAG: patatin-like phospholipase family protein [Acidobacteriota bacterium]